MDIGEHVYIVHYSSPSGCTMKLIPCIYPKDARIEADRIWNEHVELFPEWKGRKKEYSEYGNFTFGIKKRKVK